MSESKENKNSKKDQSKKPDWISIIEKSPNDITQHMYELFKNSTLSTNFEEELKEELKNQKRSSRE